MKHVWLLLTQMIWKGPFLHHLRRRFVEFPLQVDAMCAVLGAWERNRYAFGSFRFLYASVDLKKLLKNRNIENLRARKSRKIYYFTMSEKFWEKLKLDTNYRGRRLNNVNLTNKGNKRNSTQLNLSIFWFRSTSVVVLLTYSHFSIEQIFPWKTKKMTSPALDGLCKSRCFVISMSRDLLTTRTWKKLCARCGTVFNRVSEKKYNFHLSRNGICLEVS